MKPAALFLISLCAFAAAPTTEIKVDQVGYLPHSPKLGMVVSHTLAKEFSVHRAGNDSVAFHAKLTEPANDPDSGESEHCNHSKRQAAQTQASCSDRVGPDTGLPDLSKSGLFESIAILRSLWGNRALRRPSCRMWRSA